MTEWILLLSQKLLRSVQNLLPHMREDANATRQCIVNDAVVQPMPNMQQNTAITFYAF